MPEKSLFLIADLASKDAQVRFTVNGSDAGYLDPNDLVTDAFDFCERARFAALWFGIPEDKALAVAQFKQQLETHRGCVERYTRATVADLVERDRDWASLRDSAAGIVTLFGGTLAS